MKLYIKNFFNNEKKIILTSILIGFIITIFVSSKTKGYINTQSNIAKKVIRFHVLANSDTKEDQNLKLKVKTEVIKMLEKDLKNSKTLDETKKVLLNNLNKIKNKSIEIIHKNGFDYNVKVNISNSNFPTKNYGNISLPAGQYNALKIEIGDAKGQNWWCVMFPPLCFVDATAKVIPKKDNLILKNILTDDEYNLISQKNNKFSVKIKFKILEYYNKNKNTKNNKTQKNRG